MSFSKHTNLICIIITILSVVLTVVFMNAESLGVTVVTSDATADEDGIFSDRDLDPSYSEATAVYIDLDDIDGYTSGGAYELDGDLYIVTAGTYVLSGTLTNNQIIVDASDAKVQLVLNGINITNDSLPAIYVAQADKVFITLEEDSQNVVESYNLSGDAAVAANVDAAIYSVSDLTINGYGSLSVVAEGGHGIKSKDDLVIAGGTIAVTADDNALLGKDSVRICDGTLNLTAGNDGIKSNNETNEEKGYVTITGGTFTIVADHDGISAVTNVTISGGDFDITTGGGYENAAAHSDDMMGGGGGGMGGHGDNGGADHADFELTQENIEEFISGLSDEEISKLLSHINVDDLDEDLQEYVQSLIDEYGITEDDSFEEMPDMGQGMNGAPGDMDMSNESGDDNSMPDMKDGAGMEDGSDPSAGQNSGTDAENENGFDASSQDYDSNDESSADTSEEESDSAKGIKAGDTITISGGTFVINSSDDAIHSDNYVDIVDGNFTISAGDDGIHADNQVDIENGNIVIETSYEGIEGYFINIYDGDISITSSDDGMNAGGSTDMSSMGMMGGQMPGGNMGGGKNMGGGQGMNFDQSNDDNSSTDSSNDENGDLASGEEFNPSSDQDSGNAPMDMNAASGTDSSDSASDTDNTDTSDGASSESTQIQCLAIYGGNIYVDADGDGLDSNGDLIIYGGNVVVNGPEGSDNAALDSGTESGGELIVKGGTVIALGSSGMMEAFSDDSEQNSFALVFENGYSSGDEITITDSEGNIIYEYTAVKSGTAIIFSSEDLELNETYTVTVNDESEEITLDSVSTSSTTTMGGGMGGQMSPMGGGGMGQGGMQGGHMDKGGQNASNSSNNADSDNSSDQDSDADSSKNQDSNTQSSEEASN